jgi:hypothetical protein
VGEAARCPAGGGRGVGRIRSGGSNAQAQSLPARRRSKFQNRTARTTGIDEGGLAPSTPRPGKEKKWGTVYIKKSKEIIMLTDGRVGSAELVPPRLLGR